MAELCINSIEPITRDPIITTLIKCFFMDAINAAVKSCRSIRSVALGHCWQWLPILSAGPLLSQPNYLLGNINHNNGCETSPVV